MHNIEAHTANRVAVFSAELEVVPRVGEFIAVGNVLYKVTCVTYRIKPGYNVPLTIELMVCCLSGR